MAVPDNFGGLEKPWTDLDKSKIVILPVPFDKTSSWMKGADKGPETIIEASAHMELYDIDTGREVYEEGIHTADPITAVDAADMIRKVEQEIRRYKDKFVVLLGGEHTVSIGAFNAHSDVTVVQLDAHADQREDYEGDPLSHACVMARCPHKSIQVGIRSMSSGEKLDTVFFAKDIVGKKDWIDGAIGQMSDRVYVTIDLDVFDPGIMPSTGTPEPGGLSWYDVIDFLREIAKNRTVVGFDVVELCPDGTDKAPDFLAAKLIYSFLSMIFPQKHLNSTGYTTDSQTR